MAATTGISFHRTEELLSAAKVSKRKKYRPEISLLSGYRSIILGILLISILLPGEFSL
jgi:hypothetical protein